MELARFDLVEYPKCVSSRGKAACLGTISVAIKEPSSVHVAEDELSVSLRIDELPLSGITSFGPRKHLQTVATQVCVITDIEKAQYRAILQWLRNLRTTRTRCEEDDSR